MATLNKYSFGTGDRFGKEGNAQLQAILKIRKDGVEVSPVWNKSEREHQTVNSKPEEVTREAREAVESLGFSGDYFIDADHINRETVDAYLEHSNFFTIDVAQYIGKSAEAEDKEEFKQFFQKYTRGLSIPGIGQELRITERELEEMTDTFLFAMKKASEVYFYIESKKEDEFYTEVSIDEVENPQTPTELFFILAALGYYQIPITTIAPKFTGNFYKGIDYEGDLETFTKEFEENLLVLAFAKKEFHLPEELKISVHTGSDKFSLYPIINKLIKKHDAGLHLKTAGTTWLEEAIGMAEHGGKGFEVVHRIYKEALDRYDELTANYAEVIAIDKSKLPEADSFKDGASFASVLRHDQSNPAYNPHLRQLMHCAYKIAGEQEAFHSQLEECRESIEKNVTYNLYERHLKVLFG